MSSQRPATTINSLPDNVLLDTFDIYRMNEATTPYPLPWKWQRLAHVCRTWRDIIFASSCRLKLELLCTNGTPVRKILGHLPALPLFIYFPDSYEDSDEDNIIAALEHSNRVHVLRVTVSYSQLGEMATLKEPFSALTDLWLASKSDDSEPMPVLPDAFLGGNTPRLQRIYLDGIPFPATPTLLSSARDLVSISILHIPDDGYISPEAMVASLAALPRLKYLSFGFQCGTPFPRRIRPPPILPPTSRAVLPFLATFMFDGLFEYLEDFVAQIDTPQLECLKVDYLDEDEGVDFQIPQLRKFINRSEIFKQHQFKCANLDVWGYAFSLELDEGRAFRICVLDEWISEMLSQISGTLSSVDRLCITSRFPGLSLEDPGEELGNPIRWVELLRPFTAVKAMSVEDSLSRHVALALNSVTGESAAEVLPALELLCLENEEMTVKDFVATRRNLGRPVTFINSTTKFKKKLWLNTSDSE